MLDMVDTDVAMLDTVAMDLDTETMVDTDLDMVDTVERDLLMPNLNLMQKAMLTLGTVVALDFMADMVKDTVDMLVMD